MATLLSSPFPSSSVTTLLLSFLNRCRCPPIPPLVTVAPPFLSPATLPSSTITTALPFLYRHHHPLHLTRLSSPSSNVADLPFLHRLALAPSTIMRDDGGGRGEQRRRRKGRAATATKEKREGHSGRGGRGGAAVVGWQRRRKGRATTTEGEDRGDGRHLERRE